MRSWDRNLDGARFGHASADPERHRIHGAEQRLKQMAYAGGCIAVRLEVVADARIRALITDGDEIGDLQPGGKQRLLYVRRAGAPNPSPGHTQNDPNRSRTRQTRNNPR